MKVSLPLSLSLSLLSLSLYLSETLFLCIFLRLFSSMPLMAKLQMHSQLAASHKQPHSNRFESYPDLLITCSCRGRAPRLRLRVGGGEIFMDRSQQGEKGLVLLSQAESRRYTSGHAPVHYAAMNRGVQGRLRRWNSVICALCSAVNVWVMS